MVPPEHPPGLGHPNQCIHGIRCRPAGDKDYGCGPSYPRTLRRTMAAARPLVPRPGGLWLRPVSPGTPRTSLRQVLGTRG